MSQSMGAMGAPEILQNASTAYISGDVIGTEKFQYGKFVTTMYIPDKKGTTAGFFTMYAGAYEDWNSIEIELVPSVDQHPMSLDLSYGDGTTRIQEQTYHQGDFFDNWHTFVFEWTPDYVSFACDGVVYKYYDSSDPGVYNQYRPQNIELNYWSTRSDEHPPEDWHAGFDDSTMPFHLYYDYVEAYYYNQTTKEFELAWRDDFNQGTLDTSRWQV